MPRYVGDSNIIFADQRRQIHSLELKNLQQYSGIKEHPSGVEIYNALVVGERYYSFLWRVYHICFDGKPNISPHYSLKFYGKSTNESAVPSGLVSTLFVFGILPRIQFSERYSA